MATIAVHSGFDFGSTDGIVTGNAGNKVFDGVTGTLGVNVQLLTAAAYSGGYGLRCTGSSDLGWGTDSLGTGKTVITGVMRIKVSTDPAAAKTVFYHDTAAITQDVGIKYVPASDTFQAFNGATTQLGNVTVLPGEWHLLEWEYDCSGATHTFAWRIDGVAQTNCNRAKTASTVATLDLSGDAVTGAFDYDNVVVSVTAGDYPLGEHKVVLLSVDPAGTVTVNGTTGNFQTFAGATPTLTAWNATTARNNTDEIPVNVGSAQDGWAQITTASTDYVESPLTSYQLAPGETVAAGRLLAPMWAASATANTIGLRSWNGTTERTLFAAADPNADNSATPAWVCRMLTPADIDTQAELDALAIRAGFSTDAGVDVGVHAIYVEVAIKTPPVTPPKVFTQYGGFY